MCVHIAVPLKEKDDSLQTFIEHVKYTNNMKNIIFHLSSPRAESARAFTGRRNSHSGRGEDFLTGQPDFLRKQL